MQEILKVVNEAECLYDQGQLNLAIDAMSREISQKLSNANPVVLCVLNGGIIPTAEIIKRLDFPMELESIKVGRYHGETYGSTIQWSLEPGISLMDRVVLIIDDILDEGITLAEIKRYCVKKGAKSVYAAVVVEKATGRSKATHADFTGVVAENKYLFGYGMDYKGYLRNWPGIYACKDIV